MAPYFLAFCSIVESTVIVTGMAGPSRGISRGGDYKMDYRDQMDGYALFSVGVEDATEAGVCGPYEPGTVLVYRATSLPIFGREIAAARDEAEAKDIVRQMIAGTYVSSLDWRRAVAQRAADAINGDQA